MKINPIATTVILLFANVLLATAALFAQSNVETEKISQWKTPAANSVKAQALQWLSEKKVDDKIRLKADTIWSKTSEQPTEEELLNRLAATFALVDANAEKMVALCSQARAGLTLTDQSWLADPQTAPFVAQNMRLFYARWLAQVLLFEEAREQLKDLEPSDVVAPATLLFYQSVVYHKLLEKESGLKSIELLLSTADTSPKRYVAVAKLMQDDLKDLEDDSLDHIARRMDDIKRRLDLGRAGPKVRQVEDGVIESLDKLIKKIEDQQQQQQQSSAGANNLRSSAPAQDSMPRGGKGPGDVTKKNIGSESDWGNLPPKQREEALQQIGRDFPSHYRDVIEQYFKRLATEENE